MNDNAMDVPPLVGASYEGVNELAPEARKKLAAAEGRVLDPSPAEA